jgi:hypothetical protein
MLSFRFLRGSYPFSRSTFRPALRRTAYSLPILGLVFLSACQTDSPKEPVPAAIAPGTVRLQVAVKSCESTESGTVSCDLSVIHVSEYGSSVGSLPVGTVITASFEGRAPAGTDVAPDSIFAVDQQLDLTLFRQMTKEGASARPPWRAAEIH